MEAFNGEKALEYAKFLVEEIGIREAGQKGEHQASDYIKNQFEEFNLTNVRKEVFTVPTSIIGKAELIRKKDGKKFDIVPVNFTGSSPAKEVTGDLLSLDSISHISYIQPSLVRDKIVFVYINRFVQRDISGFYNNMKELFEANPVGVIFIDEGPSLREPYPWVPNNLIQQFKGIPMAGLSYDDAIECIESGTGKFQLIIEETHSSRKSYNVLAELPGKHKESLLISAHYDSVGCSPGAADNAGGTAVVLELARILCLNNTPNFTVKFAAFGSEELGLVGSRFFTKKDDTRIKTIMCNLNIDVAGNPVGQLYSMVQGPQELTSLITLVSREMGLICSVSSNSPGGSDNTSLAYVGIPSVHFGRTGASITTMHSKMDAMKYLSANSLEKMGEFVRTITERYINAKNPLFLREIPSELHEKIKKYVDKFFEEKTDEENKKEK